MIFFIIGVLAALVALAVLLLSEEGKAAAFIPGVVAVIMIGVSCVSYVPTGYTGIVTTFGKVEDGTKDAGVVFKSPWQSIVKMDNRVQEMNMDLSAFSSDIQEVATSVAVGYRINQQNAMTIYKSVGKKYEDTLITPRVQETVKAVVAHYDASSLISNRDAVASQMDTKLREVLAEYNIDLQVVQVLNIGICGVLPLLMMDAAAGIADSFLCQLCAVLAVPVLVHPPGVTAAKFVINGGAVNPQSFRDTLHADPIEVIFFQLPTILNRQMSSAQSSLIPLVA